MSHLRGMKVNVEFGESSLTIHPSFRGGPLDKMRQGERTIPYDSIVSVEFKDAATWSSCTSIRRFAKAVSTLGPGWLELRMKDSSRERITFGGTLRKDYEGFV